MNTQTAFRVYLCCSVFAQLSCLSACLGQVHPKPVISIAFERICPGGVAQIEDTCRQIKVALKGTQTQSICVEAAVSSHIMSELCGRIDAGWDECLPMLRLKSGRATMETPQATYVVTNLERVYP